MYSELGNWGMQMTAFMVPREHLGIGNSAGRLSHSLIGLLIGLDET